MIVNEQVLRLLQASAAVYLIVVGVPTLNTLPCAGLPAAAVMVVLEQASVAAGIGQVTFELHLSISLFTVILVGQTENVGAVISLSTISNLVAVTALPQASVAVHVTVISSPVQ